MARIWLHIGHGKTGTSSIQWAMAERSRLCGDVIYPEQGRAGGQVAHHGLFPLRGNAYEPSVVQSLRRLAAQFGQGPEPIVLSSEHLCHASAQKVRQISRSFDAHDLRVIYYIRRQEDLMESGFRQRQAAHPGACPDPALYVERFAKGFNFEECLQPWRKTLEDRAFLVRLYHPDIIGSDVVGDFERLLGLPEWPDRTPAQRNLSLTAAGTRNVMAAAAETGPDQARALARELRGTHVEGDNSPFYDASARKAIMERYQASNERVARRHLDARAAALLLGPN
ncbi:hypothetical protein D1114_12505 [Cereibacter sphaeroides]|uniref:Sulfotransferase family protein n=1 Tax=Cereibacter sphaeroides TaxID=1063 RepID=A0AAX1UJX4_CERSP|nr:hypothetical protein [Cereibacter sphaeroides]RHZ94222.1 hypothetical protein D1114_12505 [Cereibacter sphaeroides]